jgi:hypothetical protein
MRFRATLELHGRTATGFPVPDDVVAALGAGKRPPVRVTINGHTYRSTVASMGGRYMIGVSAQHREGARVAAGDEIDVDLELDTAPREVSVPDDLGAALAEAPDAQRFFEGLSYTKKQWFVQWIEQAKKAETRQRRVAEAVTMLREGRSGR